MAQYYTVRFTTEKLIKKFGPKGQLISETKMDTPVCITALPYSTAMSYSGCDNFEITPYAMDERRTPKGSGRDASVGNGTKKVKFDRVREGHKAGEVVATVASSTKGHSKLSQAATTGDLAAALNR